QREMARRTREKNGVQAQGIRVLVHLTSARRAQSNRSGVLVRAWASPNTRSRPVLGGILGSCGVAAEQGAAPDRAAILVSRDTAHLQAARQVSLVVRRRRRRFCFPLTKEGKSWIGDYSLQR